jgi:hypothetical protein
VYSVLRAGARMRARTTWKKLPRLPKQASVSGKGEQNVEYLRNGANVLKIVVSTHKQLAHVAWMLAPAVERRSKTLEATIESALGES